MTDFRALARFYQGEEGLAEYHRETLQLIMVAIIGASFILALLPLESWDPIPLVGGLWATVGAMYLASRSRPIVSVVAMVLGLTATLMVQLYFAPGSTVAIYACIIVLAAGGALGWSAGLGTAGLVSLAILGFAGLRPGTLTPEVSAQALVLIWVTPLLAWLSARPLRSAVGWAWYSYALAQANVEEARLRQAELARLSKSLNETLDKLERLNRDLYEARKAADVARQMKAEFAATVGHELRTPINLIVGFSQMMASPQQSSYYEEPLPGCYRGDIAAIHQNACHISDLIDDILDLSQVDAHRLALHKERISLAQAAQEAASSVASLYQEAGLRLAINLPENLPRILADPVRIRQILINLLYNAVRFTHDGGVVIGARTTDTEVMVDVADSGVGIPAADLPRLFEGFRQLHPPMRGHGGSGLGLAVCKRFVELHGGSIWAESAPERGTTITFSLPQRESVIAVPLERSAGQPSPHGQGHPMVAVLDPDGDTTRLLQRYLDGHHVKRLTDPALAGRLAQGGGLEAFILTRATDQDAWHDYQRAHPEVREVPTLSCFLRRREVAARDPGIAAYLVKPINRKQLASALHRIGHPVRNLVVIEDDAGMRTLVHRLVRSLLSRCRIAEAGDGASGLQLIREKRPDAVLLDLALPLMDGRAVLQAIQLDDALRGIPVIVISATDPNEKIIASMIGVSRHDGLTVGEAMACLKADLDALRRVRLEPS